MGAVGRVRDAGAYAGHADVKSERYVVFMRVSKGCVSVCVSWRAGLGGWSAVWSGRSVGGLLGGRQGQNVVFGGLARDVA